MFSKKKKVEDQIITLLVQGPLTTTALIDAIKKDRSSVTKQAVYKALRKLREDEVVAHKKTNVALSSVWLNKLSLFVEQAHLNYKTANRPGLAFLRLKEGEKMAYVFKTLESTDMFWVHVFDALFDTTPKEIPVLIYNPHDWFLFARHESEMFLLERFKKAKKKLYLLVGHREKLDLAALKYVVTAGSEYAALTSPPFPLSNYYANVFGDFLIEVWLDAKISKEVDLFYKKTVQFDERAKQKLFNIVKKSGRTKLVISRNKRKATKMYTLFRKHFLIPVNSKQKV
jgi:hypothetical protein